MFVVVVVTLPALQRIRQAKQPICQVTFSRPLAWCASKKGREGQRKENYSFRHYFNVQCLLTFS